MKTNMVILISQAGFGFFDQEVMGLMNTDGEKEVAASFSRCFDVTLHNQQKGILMTPDIVNYFRNSRRIVELNHENLDQNLSVYNYQPLNGIYLLDFLTKKGFAVELIRHFDFEPVYRLKGLLENGPLAIIISTTFILSPLTIKRIGSFIRKHNKEVPIILGGQLLIAMKNEPSVSIPLIASMLKGVIDIFIFEHQGELALFKVLKYLQEGGDLKDVANIAYFDNGALVFTQEKPESNGLDANLISWDQIGEKYLDKIACIQTSRGCPFKCAYCAYGKIEGKTELKSIECLKAELKALSQRSVVKNIIFIDDTFGLTEKRLVAICEMMDSQSFGLNWWAQTRASIITKKTGQLMKKSGCKAISLGIESGDRGILTNMKKDIFPDDIMKAVGILHDNEILVHGHFLIGFPGETERSINNTISFINESGVDFYTHYVFYYYHQAAVFDERRRYKLEGAGWNWKHATMDSKEAAQWSGYCYKSIESNFVKGSDEIMVLYDAGYNLETIKRICCIKNELVNLSFENGCLKQEQEACRHQLLSEFEQLSKHSD